MLPILTGKAKRPLHDSLYWDGAEGRTAIRSGPWKLVTNGDKVELFNLQQDLPEKLNLAAQKPEVVAQLREKFDTWSKANAPRIGKGGANDEDEAGGARKKTARKRGK